MSIYGEKGLPQGNKGALLLRKRSTCPNHPVKKGRDDLSGTDIDIDDLSGTDIDIDDLSGTDIDIDDLSGTDIDIDDLSGTDIHIDDLSGTAHS